MRIGPGSIFRSSIHIVAPIRLAPLSPLSIDIAMHNLPGPLAMFVSRCGLLRSWRIKSTFSSGSTARMRTAAGYPFGSVTTFRQ